MVAAATSSGTSFLGSGFSTEWLDLSSCSFQFYHPSSLLPSSTDKLTLEKVLGVEASLLRALSQVLWLLENSKANWRNICHETAFLMRVFLMRSMWCVKGCKEGLFVGWDF